MRRPSEPRLRTSQEAYHQIRWDPRLAGRPFVLLVENRPEGLKEIPFAAFLPDGDIPWHRISQILLDGRPVWSREARLDHLDQLASDGPPTASSTPAPTQTSLHHPSLAPGVHAPPPVALQNGVVVDLAPRAPRRPAAPGAGALRAATFNVLCDAFDAELIATERRFPAIARELGQLGADLLGLSEVTPALHGMLLAQPWASEGYFFSDGGGSSVRPHGQLLLSRWPILAASFLALTATRRVLCCDVQHPAGPLRVLVVHLVSNATPDAARLRRAELERTFALLEGHPRALVMGDLNLDEDESRDLIEAAGLRDPWRELLPEDPGFTYAPAENTLAALFSRSGQARRFDRVLSRGAFVPCGAGLFATEPLPGAERLFHSDHFGLFVDLRGEAAGSLEAAAPTYHTALALVPPRGCWPAIEALRAAGDRGYLRWPPHTTLIYGFAPDVLFPEALSRVAQVCREIAPFPVHLAAAGRFDHGGSSTVWLDPQSHGALPALQAALQRAFPRFSEQGDRGFTPHLTVARFPKAQRDRALALERALRASFAPLDFSATEVHLLARRGDLPFASVARVQLGSGKVLAGLGPRGDLDPWADPRPLADDPELRRREAALERIRALVVLEAERLGHPAPWVEPSGSALYLPELPGIDVDLVALCPRGFPATQALRAIHEGLLREGAPSRLLLDVPHPVVRASLGGVEVDISAAELREPHAPGPVVGLPGRLLGGLPEPERGALRAVLDGHTLRLAVASHRERWRWLLRVVRRWTEARGLRGQWAGYPGGMSWAVLAARYCMDHPYEQSGALLQGFLGWCEGRPWPAPVALGEPGEALPVAGATAGVMPVLAPAQPPRDTARTVTEGSLRVLRGELRRAVGLVSEARRHQAAAGELFEEATPLGQTHRLVVRGDAPEREEQRGRAQASLLAEVAALEAQGRRVRVYARWQPCPEGEELRLGLDEEDAHGGAAPRPTRGRGGRR